MKMRRREERKVKEMYWTGKIESNTSSHAALTFQNFINNAIIYPDTAPLFSRTHSSLSGYPLFNSDTSPSYPDTPPLYLDTYPSYPNMSPLIRSFLLQSGHALSYPDIFPLTRGHSSWTEKAPGGTDTKTLMNSITQFLFVGISCPRSPSLHPFPLSPALQDSNSKKIRSPSAGTIFRFGTPSEWWGGGANRFLKSLKNA